MEKMNNIMLIVCLLAMGALIGILIVAGVNKFSTDDKQDYSSGEIICGLGPGMLIQDDAGELFVPVPEEPSRAYFGFFWWKDLHGGQGFMAPPYPFIEYVDSDCVPYQAFLNYIQLLRTQKTHEVLNAHELSCVKYWVIIRDSEGQHLFPARGAPYLVSATQFYWVDYDGEAHRVSFLHNSEEKRTMIVINNPRCVLESILDQMADDYNKKKEDK